MGTQWTQQIPVSLALCVSRATQEGPVLMCQGIPVHLVPPVPCRLLPKSLQLPLPSCLLLPAWERDCSVNQMEPVHPTVTLLSFLFPRLLEGPGGIWPLSFLHCTSSPSSSPQVQSFVLSVCPECSFPLLPSLFPSLDWPWTPLSLALVHAPPGYQLLFSGIWRKS